MLNEITGTLEVYWEQLRSLTRTKRGKRLLAGGYTNDGIQDDEHAPDDAEKSPSTAGLSFWRRSARADSRSKFLDANVVFG